MRVEIYKSKKEWRFRIVARNGKIVAHGESYKRKQTMIRTIRLIINMEKDTPIMEVIQ